MRPVGNRIVAQMLFLRGDPEKDVRSHQLPGGSITAGLAIYDTIVVHQERGSRLHGRRPAWKRFCCWLAPKGKRFALPN